MTDICPNDVTGASTDVTSGQQVASTSSVTADNCGNCAQSDAVMLHINIVIIAC